MFEENEMFQKSMYRIGEYIRFKVRYSGNDEDQYDFVEGVVSELTDEEIMLDLSDKDGYSVSLYYWEIQESYK